MARMGKKAQGGGQWAARWLRILCLARIALCVPELLELLVWMRNAVRPFVGPTHAALIPCLAVFATASVASALALFRFASDAASLAGAWAWGDRRRWVLGALVGLTLLLAVPATTLAGFWLHGLPEAFGASVRAAIERVAADGDKETSLLLDELQSSYRCCGADNPLDWLGKKTETQETEETETETPRTGNETKKLVLLRGRARSGGLWRVGTWMVSPGEGGELGCGMLRERRGGSVEDAGRVCALPPSCCEWTSSTCTPLFLLYARTSEERAAYHKHFTERGCVEAVRADWPTRYAGLILFFPSVGILLAQVGLWALVEWGATKEGVDVALGSAAESAAVVWGWDWGREPGLATAAMEAGEEASMSEHESDWTPANDSVRDVHEDSARPGEHFTKK